MRKRNSLKGLLLTAVIMSTTINGVYAQTINSGESQTYLENEIREDIINNGTLNVVSNHHIFEGIIQGEGTIGQIYPSYLNQNHLGYDVTGSGVTNFKAGENVNNIPRDTVNVSSNVQTEINVYNTLNVINRDETGSAIKFGSAGKNINICASSVRIGKNINIYASSVRIGKNVDIEGSLKLYSEADADIYSAESIKADVENGGILAIYNGTLSHNIKNTASEELLNKELSVLPESNTGGMTTYLPGMVIMTGTNNSKIDASTLSTGRITHPLYKYGDKSEIDDRFITNASDVTTKYGIDNRGTLILTGGTNKNYIGTFNINKDGTRNVFKEFDEEAALTSSRFTIGNVIIQGDVVNEAQIDNPIFIQSGLLNNTNGKIFDVTANEGTSLITSISNVTGNITLKNSSTLDISGNGTDRVNNLFVEEGNTANLAIDWGDNVATDNILGSLVISYADLTSTDKSTAPYTFATGENLKNISISEAIQLKTTDTSFNSIKYNSLSGELSGAKISLVDAVKTSETGDIATYVMTGDETAGGDSLEGTLKIQGNGNSITGQGLKVGSTSTVGADLTLEDTNINVAGKAIEVFGGSKITVNALKDEITLQTTDGSEVIALNKGTSSTNANAELKGAKTINITGDIVSDDVNNILTIASGATVNHNGLLDPITLDVYGTENRTGGYDETVTYNIYSGGSVNFTNDTTLYDPSHHTSAMLNTINFNGGSLNTINGVATDFHLANMSLNGTSNFYADVDLANQTMDKFTVDNAVTGTGKLNVAGLNLISDAKDDNTTINFTSDPILMAATSYTGSQGLKALSPIYKYNVDYDSSTGNFNFARLGGTSPTSSDFNPAILASPVAAQLGGYLIQLNSYDEAFRNMDMYMLMTRDERQAMKLRNKYADLNAVPVYDDTKAISENASGWFRPFVNFESVGLKNGPKVKNNIYGTFAGFDSGITELGNGWDGMWGIYAGYNGSHQHYDGIGIYQNGGTLGLTGMLYKDNFFTGLTANVGANAGNASTMYGNDDFAMLMTGIASKTGYNWELAEGKFIIQPNYQMSYSMVNTFDYTNNAGVRINSDPLHAITFEPGVKFIGNLKNGWQPYAGVSVVWNVMDKTKFKANDVSLPNMSVKPFVKYGVGLRKTWGERLTGFLQAFMTNGGRNGVGFQAGFKWALGKAPEKNAYKSDNKMPQRVQTKITLNNI